MLILAPPVDRGGNSTTALSVKDLDLGSGSEKVLSSAGRHQK